MLILIGILVFSAFLYRKSLHPLLRRSSVLPRRSLLQRLPSRSLNFRWMISCPISLTLTMKKTILFLSLLQK